MGTNQPNKNEERIKALENSLASMKKKLTLISIVGVLLGGGGIASYLNWNMEQKKLKREFFKDNIATRIASLERTIERTERLTGETDSEEIRDLYSRIEDLEEELRENVESYKAFKKRFNTYESQLKRKGIIEVGDSGTLINN